jgi:hypothetical protein
MEAASRDNLGGIMHTPLAGQLRWGSRLVINLICVTGTRGNRLQFLILPLCFA